MLLVVVSLFLSPWLAAAQASEPAAPVKGVDKILIFTADTGQVVLNRMIEALTQTGFELDTAVVGFAQTLYVPIVAAYESAVPATVSARVRVRPGNGGSIILLDGDCLAESRLPPDTKVKTEPARYAGKRRSVPRAAFRMLRGAALAYPNGKVLYRRWDAGTPEP
ncbi:hypothetical protein EJV47_24385 [Hymenobacter gummosus]|uniref:Uncharacterized protein n=2 Tax=Hymenobacter gummosus TaxID=1776032 RepID=A0A3S0H2H8_9BACT|nr:hypothetical protein EJV47_24385 [Hymenobacter gummosus]